MEQKLYDFLLNHRLSAESFPLKEEVARLMGEMASALQGADNSLAMIPAFLPASVAAPASGRVAVLDAGGTNLRVGTVEFADGRPQKIQYEKFPIPGTERELDKQEFFDAVAAKLLPYLQGVTQIGFCFSYAAGCMENGDAQIHGFCKEVKVRDAKGAFVCAELLAAIRRQGVEREFTCVQLNDTVAAMLGAMADFGIADYSGYMGVILGTGFNSCYGEKTAAIGKYTGSAYGKETMVVNMESGSYTGFCGGDLDRGVDEKSALPMDHLTEKMLSGAYLGKLLAMALASAKAEGFLSSDLAPVGEELPLWEANAFLAGEKSALDFLTEAEKKNAREIILALYGRSARIIAILLTSVGLKMQAQGQKPVAVAMEGSTFGKSPFLQRLLAAELETVETSYNLQFKILSAEDATLKGAALAAVSV